MPNYVTPEEKWAETLRNSDVKPDPEKQAKATVYCTRRISDPEALAEVLGALGLTGE